MAQRVKNLPAVQETSINLLVKKIPWRRKWQPTAVFLPGEFHGQRSRAGTVHGSQKNQTEPSDQHFHFQRILSGVCMCVYLTQFEDILENLIHPIPSVDLPANLCSSRKEGF